MSDGPARETRGPAGSPIWGARKHDTSESAAGRYKPGATVSITAPQLVAGEGGALRQRFELGPGNLRVDAAAETAIGRGDDPLAADDLGKAQNAVGDQLGMLDDIGRVADDSGQQDLVVGQSDL